MLKKFLILGIAVTLFFSLTACRKDDEAPGTFYGLQEAYDEGLLTQEDLKSIAYYLNGSDDENYTPIPKNPEVLSAETEKAIKETKAYNLRNQTYPDGTKMCPKAKAEDVTIIGYFGMYNSYVAIMITDCYHYYTTALRNSIIGEVLFRYVDGNSIIIWKAK